MCLLLRIVILFPVLAALVAPASAMDVFVHPQVVTNSSVDCSSIETVVRDVVKPGMSDEEKLLALYHWFRRTIYHYRMMGADRRDVLRVLNSYGGLLCGSQASVFRMLLNAAGLKARVTSGDGGKELGHTVLEVWYGGLWHVIDTMSAFYVRTRGSRTISSMADLAGDPTLVTSAIEEERCGPEFLYCVRHKQTGFTTRRRFEASGAPDVPWTLFVIAPDEDGKFQDVMTFWLRGPKKASYKDPGDSYSARYVPGLLDITLKPNEEYVRLWDNTGRWMKLENFDITGPYHTCGSADEFDPVNFKYYEPYKKESVGFAPYAYRYFANGWLDWQPAGSEILLGAKPENLTFDGQSGVFTARSSGAALRIPVKSPYAAVETVLELDVKSADPGTSVSILCTPGSDDYNRGIRPQIETLTPLAGPARIAFDVGSRKDLKGGVFSYDIAIVVAGGKAAFAVKRVKTTFMLNMYSLPFLVPGNNKVTVSGAGAAGLQVTYEWAEGNGWEKQRRNSRLIRSFPSTYSVKVAGSKMPRMRRLTMKAVSSSHPGFAFKP